MQASKLILGLCWLALAGAHASESEKSCGEAAIPEPEPEVSSKASASTGIFTVYSLHPNDPIFAATPPNDPVPLATYSGMVSPPFEMTTPVRFSRQADAGTFVEWTPDHATPSENWLLVFDHDADDPDLPVVHSIPMESTGLAPSTLFLINLSDFELSGTCGGTEVTLAPAAHQPIELKSGRLAIELRSTTTPHRAISSFSDLERSGRYLMILTQPFMKNSASLGYRLVQVPDTLIE